MNAVFSRCLIAAAGLAAFGLASGAQAAPGQLSQSWKTDGGWLTELRVHPNGAKVCSLGKPGSVPHKFALAIVRSGTEKAVMVVDEQSAPTSGAKGDLVFTQGGRTIGTVPAQVDGPAWVSSDIHGPQVGALIGALSAQPLSIAAGGQTYQLDLNGLPGALAQLDACMAQAAG